MKTEFTKKCGSCKILTENYIQCEDCGHRVCLDCDDNEYDTERQIIKCPVCGKEGIF
jgi:DNA-directed RNA polymerase subunit RPC12/RpoP